MKKIKIFLLLLIFILFVSTPAIAEEEINIDPLKHETNLMGEIEDSSEMKDKIVVEDETIAEQADVYEIKETVVSDEKNEEVFSEESETEELLSAENELEEVLENLKILETDIDLEVETDSDINEFDSDISEFDSNALEPVGDILDLNAETEEIVSELNINKAEINESLTAAGSLEAEGIVIDLEDFFGTNDSEEIIKIKESLYISDKVGSRYDIENFILNPGEDFYIRGLNSPIWNTVFHDKLVMRIYMDENGNVGSEYYFDMEFELVKTYEEAFKLDFGVFEKGGIKSTPYIYDEESGKIKIYYFPGVIEDKSSGIEPIPTYDTIQYTYDFKEMVDILMDPKFDDVRVDYLTYIKAVSGLDNLFDAGYGKVFDSLIGASDDEIKNFVEQYYSLSYIRNDLES